MLDVSEAESMDLPEHILFRANLVNALASTRCNDPRCDKIAHSERPVWHVLVTIHEMQPTEIIQNKCDSLF